MRRLLGGLGGVFAGILPVVTCPACWPMYASALSSLGVSFLGFGTGQLAVVGTLMALALVSLAFDLRRHRKPGPILLGVAASVCILITRAQMSSLVVSYIGSALFLCSAIWNVVLIRKCQGTTASTIDHCVNCREER